MSNDVTAQSVVSGHGSVAAEIPVCDLATFLSFEGQLLCADLPAGATRTFQPHEVLHLEIRPSVGVTAECNGVTLAIAANTVEVKVIPPLPLTIRNETADPGTIEFRRLPPFAPPTAEMPPADDSARSPEPPAVPAKAKKRK